MSYIASLERQSYNFTPCSLAAASGGQNCNGTVVAGGMTAAQDGLPWPDNTNLYQRLDATLRYYFDPGDAAAVRLERQGHCQAALHLRAQRRLVLAVRRSQRLLWETLTGNTELTGTSRSTFLAYDNPNYTVQLIAASLTFKW